MRGNEERFRFKADAQVHLIDPHRVGGGHLR